MTNRSNAAARRPATPRGGRTAPLDGPARLLSPHGVPVTAEPDLVAALLARGYTRV